jgi:hypothetical protein
VAVKGLPPDATEEEIVAFFSNLYPINGGRDWTHEGDCWGLVAPKKKPRVPDNIVDYGGRVIGEWMMMRRRMMVVMMMITINTTTTTSSSSSSPFSPSSLPPPSSSSSSSPSPPLQGSTCGRWRSRSRCTPPRSTRASGWPRPPSPTPSETSSAGGHTQVIQSRCCIQNPCSRVY